MSPTRSAATPRGSLHRIGRLPDPLAWPPWEAVGGGRFDDPAGRFRVLYAAARRRGAFVETLASFRPSLALLARLGQVVGTAELLPESRVPADWYRRRAVGRLRLAPGQRWLDLRAPATREALRRELAEGLLRLGLSDLDLSGVVVPTWALTQTIAGWAHGHGYAGLAYSGYTYEQLRRMAARQPAIDAVLDGIEVLVDGPYVRTLADGAGAWTGSGNQRVVDLPATRERGPVVLSAPEAGDTTRRRGGRASHHRD